MIKKLLQNTADVYQTSVRGTVRNKGKYVGQQRPLPHPTPDVGEEIVKSLNIRNK